MIRKYKLFSLLLLFSAMSFSQQLPLKTILLIIEQQHQVKFNYTDDAIAPYSFLKPETKFSLAEKLNYIEKQTNLYFEHINPTYITISIKKNILPRPVFDEMQPIHLTEVTIDNYITSGISKKSDGSYIVKLNKMGLLPGLSETDILQTMQQIPGIFSSDETISNINIRGGTHDQNFFLWNGIRLFQTGHFFGLISAFNPNLKNNVLISKNGTSAFYGESVSGLVAISSDLSSEGKYNSGWSSNLISSEFHSTIKWSPKSRFQYSIRRSLTDLFHSPTYSKYYDRIFQNTAVTTTNENSSVNYSTDEKFYFYDFSALLEQNIGDKHLLKTAFIAINNSLSLKQSTNDLINPISENSRLSQQQLGTSITWQTIWNPNNTSKFELYGSNYNLNAVNESIVNEQVLNQRNAALETGIRLENQHQLSSNLTLNTGYQYNEIGVRNNDEINIPVFSRKIKEVLRMHALVLETKWNSANKRMGFRSGIRSNYVEEFKKFILEPRFNAFYRISESIQLGVLAEQKSQNISQIIDLKNDFLGIEKRRWLLANNDNHPVQQSRQIEFNLTFNNKSWLLTFENFYKKVTGILSQSQAFQNQLEFLKINGDYTVYGTELLIQRNFKHFHTWINYSWNQNRYHFSDFIPHTFTSNYEIKQSISFAAMYELEQIRFAIGTKWFTGKPETTPLKTPSSNSNSTITYNSPNNTNVNDYVQTNFSASYRWKIKKVGEITTHFSILNLFNRKNIINRYYRLDTAQNIETVNTYSLGRTPNFSLQIKF
ncbi:TonB-dependent receptor plug domain-containing protein [Flavobacterium sp.]|uniref:TonB-dependent receptor plug domain-containing protein n=1 Tax=Flavobacterium sp. TaxID=239 RepID=UPI00262E6F87|nr:TonB-dependent receptor plug domain-containing protein [Flavobacterium sp.]MDD3005350.1 TonB-dependent receptor plug domain-containing protein [Flavobacterium sp.]